MTTTITSSEIINPYDGSVIATLPLSTQADVETAIAHAVEMKPVMASMPAHQRGAVLQRTAQLLEARAEEVAILMAKESGKPIKYARGEVARGVETFQFAADEARRLHGETVPMDAAKGTVGKFGYYIRVPVGVIGAITPFNFPLNLVVHKVAPAIAAGCPMVLKPAPATPLTSYWLLELLKEAGLPDGALQIVNGGADVGHWLTSDPRVAMITFTGSPSVAREISKVVGLRKATFELGGNAATIIDADADLDHAVSRNVMGGFAYSGQTCISVQRIYVHRSRYDEFREKYVTAVKALVTGDPLDSHTDIGPVINQTACNRIDAWVKEAITEGAELLAGGSHDHLLYTGTLLEGVTPEMKVIREEVFGPVVSLIPFENFDDALQAVNDSPYGLQAGVYTNNLKKAMKAAQTLEVGGVVINDVPTIRADHMPYGGVKDSGVGREGPRYAIEEMTQIRMVLISL